MTLDVLHRLKEISVIYGEAQIAAGADVLTFPDHATGDLVSGAYYERFLLEIHQEMVERLPVPLILHICGYTVDRLEHINRSGMASFHFDSKNDPFEAMQVADGKIGLVGNINNPVTLYSKRPDVVRQEVYRCLEAGVQMIAPECAIPLATRMENLLEIPRAVRDWSVEHPSDNHDLHVGSDLIN
jgi:[methyl-Co(III) methanol-specific corrinoid protein]:coenzyme M methyltransferase